MPQMQLHLAQAGFRSDYSTLTHAAVVYITLEQRLYARAIFLDDKLYIRSVLGSWSVALVEARIE